MRRLLLIPYIPIILLCLVNSNTGIWTERDFIPHKRSEVEEFNFFVCKQHSTAKKNCFPSKTMRLSSIYVFAQHIQENPRFTWLFPRWQKKLFFALPCIYMFCSKQDIKDVLTLYLRNESAGPLKRDWFYVEKERTLDVHFCASAGNGNIVQ